MAYSSEDDLLIGDMMLPMGFDKAKYITSATDEINGKLGFVYKLPLEPLPGLGSIPDYQTILLKTISNKLASGRLIMDVSAAGERQTIHAYARRLVDEAMNDLMCIANGDIDLSAVRRVPVDAQQDDRMVATVKNQDEESLLLGFENTVLRSEPWYSRPGAVG